jgi:hypothetical protein
VSTVQTGQPAAFEVDIDIELDVAPDGRPPFRAWTRIERLFDDCADELKPGMEVPVRFDPSDGATVIDREHIDLLHPDLDIAAAAARALHSQRMESDFAQIRAQFAPQAAEGLSSVTGLGAAGVMGAAPLREVQLAPPARHAVARIVEVQTLGGGGIATYYHVRLAVQPADGTPPFSTSTFARRPAALAAGLQPGAEVDVVYDATNPAVVLMDVPRAGG